eukprot:m.46988 g.46988  ORF g.46988 m.46988 type:complete len:333 (-) comp6331_c0_seq2:49-1047(-)
MTFRPVRDSDRTEIVRELSDPEAIKHGSKNMGDFLDFQWDRWMAAIAEGKTVLYVHEENGEIDGMWGAKLPSSTESFWFALRVKPAMRRRGIARQLWSHLNSEIARLQGPNAVARMTVTSSNERMLAFASNKLGLSEISRFRRYSRFARLQKDKDFFEETPTPELVAAYEFEQAPCEAFSLRLVTADQASAVEQCFNLLNDGKLYMDIGFLVRRFDRDCLEAGLEQKRIFGVFDGEDKVVACVLIAEKLQTPAAPHLGQTLILCKLGATFDKYPLLLKYISREMATDCGGIACSFPQSPEMEAALFSAGMQFGTATAQVLFEWQPAQIVAAL